MWHEVKSTLKYGLLCVFVVLFLTTIWPFLCGVLAGSLVGDFGVERSLAISIGKFLIPIPPLFIVGCLLGFAVKKAKFYHDQEKTNK